MANTAARPCSSTDMVETIELIRDFWPDLQFTKDDLFRCEPYFIVRFYSIFLAELNEQLFYIINEDEITTDEFNDIQELEKDVIIYCKVVKIFKRMKNMPLYLADFYISNPKKMYPYVKFSIHFSIFMNNFSDEMKKIVDDFLKKSVDREDLKMLRQQCLQDTAENAENLACLEDAYKRCKMSLEEVKKNHEKMKNDKIIDDKKTAEKTQELNIVRSEIDNAEYELQLLEDKENHLKDCIVTKTDIESLRNTEKHLEIEGQLLWDDNPDDDINEHLENDQKRLKKSAKELENFSFDTLDVETLLEHKQQVTQNQITHEKILKQFSELSDNAVTKENDVDVLQKELERTLALFTELKKRITLDVQNDQKTHAKVTADCSANFEECQRVQTEIVNMQQDTEKIKDDRSQLEAAFDKQYKIYLGNDQRVTKAFHNTLISLTRLSE